MAEMTVAGYAAHRGISREAVNAGVLAGRIPAVRGGKGRSTRIDSDLADKAWPEVGTRGRRRKKNTGAPPPDEMIRDEMPDARFKARTARDVYQARLIKLEFDRQSGKLIDAAEVEKSAFMVARTVRDALLNIPDRVSHMLAAQTDAGAVHQTLTDELMQVCADLQKAVATVGGAVAPDRAEQ